MGFCEPSDPGRSSSPPWTAPRWETLRAIRDILEDDTLEDPECVQRIDAILSAFYLKLGAEVHRRGI